MCPGYGPYCLWAKISLNCVCYLSITLQTLLMEYRPVYKTYSWHVLNHRLSTKFHNPEGRWQKKTDLQNTWKNNASYPPILVRWNCAFSKCRMHNYACNQYVSPTFYKLTYTGASPNVAMTYIVYTDVKPMMTAAIKRNLPTRAPLLLTLWPLRHVAAILTHWGRVTHIYVGKLTIIG